MIRNAFAFWFSFTSILNSLVKHLETDEPSTGSPAVRLATKDLRLTPLLGQMIFRNESARN